MVEFLSDKGLFFREFAPIDKKELGIRKRVDIYFGVDLKNYYIVLLKISQKSRFLQKNVDSLESIVNDLATYKDVNIAKKYLILDTPLCSKAKSKLLELKWSFI